MILRLHEWLVGPIPGLPLRWDCAAPMTPRIAVGLPSGLTIGRGVSPPEKQRRAAPAPVIEAGWIRDGEPIDYDGNKWYPVNDYEVLDDSEVYQIAEYRGVQVFVEKIAVKPYDRIYTKFDKNKFRYYERRNDDQS